MTVPEEGEVRAFERTFTAEDVREFAAVSGDEQPRHLEPDEEGRLMVHGLLTATMPTKLGGEMAVLGRSMTFDFHRPVYTGDTVTCELVSERVEEFDDRFDLTASVTCRNDADEVVLSGTVSGLVWKRGD